MTWNDQQQTTSNWTDTSKQSTDWDFVTNRLLLENGSYVLSQNGSQFVVNKSFITKSGVTSWNPLSFPSTNWNQNIDKNTAWNADSKPATAWNQNSDKPTTWNKNNSIINNHLLLQNGGRVLTESGKQLMINQTVINDVIISIWNPTINPSSGWTSDKVPTINNFLLLENLNPLLLENGAVFFTES